MLKIQENVSLKDFTTLKTGGLAKYFGVVKSAEELHELFTFAKSRKLPIFIIGGGSNLLISDHEFNGLVIKNEIKGIKFIDQADNSVILEVGAGEILDEVIALSVSRNLYGLENLSGIPGTIGGASVQNAGAYGAEIKDNIISVQGLNSLNNKKFLYKKKDCQYGYRTSLFKNNEKYIITMITLVLSKKPELKTDYLGLKEVLLTKNIKNAADVRNLVLEIRANKLPDWHKLPTAGSFFKNPVLDLDKYEILKNKFPDLPGFPNNNGQVKVPLAWILDKICNLKGYREGEVGLYEGQPLILVNHGQATSDDIINFSKEIKKIVKEKTGIEIVEEVEII